MIVVLGDFFCQIFNGYGDGDFFVFDPDPKILLIASNPKNKKICIQLSVQIVPSKKSRVKRREATAGKSIQSLIQREKMAPWLLRAAEKTGGFAEWDQKEITACLWITINSTMHELKSAIMSMGDFHVNHVSQILANSFGKHTFCCKEGLVFLDN